MADTMPTSTLFNIEGSLVPDAEEVLSLNLLGGMKEGKEREHTFITRYPVLFLSIPFLPGNNSPWLT